MNIEALNKKRIKDFIQYCNRHKTEVDDSFLQEEDWKNFLPNKENPTYIAVDEAGEIKAVASLMKGGQFSRGGTGRFRIFHSETEEFGLYDNLLGSVLEHTQGLNQVVLFVYMSDAKTRKHMERLGFKVERYIFLMVRGDQRVPAPVFPQGYATRAYRPGQDEEAWSMVRNASFARLRGNETPRSPEQTAQDMAAENNIEGASMILYHGDKPVGVVRGMKDIYEGSPAMSIGPLAILPEYQGKGLGRSLLRTSLRFAVENGFTKSVLCVNADNDRAKALYLEEGFEMAEAVVCYQYALK